MFLDQLTTCPGGQLGVQVKLNENLASRIPAAMLCSNLTLIYRPPRRWKLRQEEKMPTSTSSNLLHTSRSSLAHCCAIFLCYLGSDRHQYPMSNNKDHLVGQLTRSSFNGSPTWKRVRLKWTLPK